jgi:hypothetical protein
MLEWFLALAADGEPPPALLSRPEIPDHLAWVYDAFRAMWGDRHPIPYFGFGKIPFTAMDAYARRKRIESSDQFERFEALISRLDDFYMEWQGEKAKQAAQKPNGAQS